ncbi:MAG: SpoIIE family protein phosphatase [Bacteroidales bacterium]|nr:SpoIIE family protein phosphatase [Bacteroidales bacterium]
MKHLLIILFITFIYHAEAQTISNKGKLFHEKYSVKNYLESPQNWAAISDCRGIMYFGNSNGVLQYDGDKWRSIQMTNHAVVRSFAKDNNCNIYVGGSREFGELKADSTGKLYYHSFLNLLPEKIDFEDIWIIHATKNGIYFHSEKAIFRYYNHKIEIIKPNLLFHFYSSCIDDDIYVQEEGIGIVKINKSTKSVLKNTNNFSHTRFHPLSVFYINKLENGKLLFLTNSSGIFLYDGQETKIFKTDIDDYLKTSIVCFGTELINGEIAIGSILKGAAIIDKNGKLNKFINQNTCLNTNAVYSIYNDSRAILWLMQDDGIMKMEYPSPFTYFDKKEGIPGTIEDLTIYNNELIASTHAGAFKVIKAEGIGNVHLFEKADKMIWNFQNLNDKLYASTIKGIWELNNTKELIHSNYYSHCIYIPKEQDSILFLGVNDGLLKIKIDENLDKFEYIKNTNGSISSIIDFNNQIWLGSNDNGVYKIDNQKISIYDTSKGLPPGYNNLVRIANQLYAKTPEGNFLFQPTENKFILDTNYTHCYWAGSYSNNYLLSFNDDSSATYIVNNILDTIENQKNKNWHKYLMQIQANSLSFQNSVLWLSRSDELLRYDGNETFNHKKKYFVNIRKVITNNDSIIFNGEHGNIKDHELKQTINPELNYQNHNLRFEYAALFTKTNEKTLFSFKLEGYDNNWSDWSYESHTNYTSLNEGTYIFKVRAKNRYDGQAEADSYKFTILPPWYRTFSAFSLYFLAFLGFVFSIIKLNNRRLVAAKNRLEKIVIERTQEIRQQKEEIQVQRDHVAHQRDLIIEQKQEITDSINYASRIQSAVIPSKNYVSSILKDYFIFYQPRDIVSGDFYWIGEEDSKIIVIAADCTGHGVPGAFMSMLGVAFLNEIVKKEKVYMPDQILNHLRDKIIQALKQNKEEGSSKDGMDVAAYTFDLKQNKIYFSGANNPLYLISDKQLTEIKGNRMPVAIHAIMEPFECSEITIKKGDALYVFSDGFADQFGGPKGKKYKYKAFKELLLKIHSDSMQKQELLIKEEFTKWKSKHEQVDDVLVIGFKVS